MAQANKNKSKKHSNASPARQSAKAGKAVKEKYFSALVAILVITFISYLPALQNHFVWDDEPYIQNDLLIHSINLKEIFSAYVLGNYHPLTILVLALEYQLFGLSDMGYHLVNVLLHLANVVLVFYVILSLSERVPVALVAALLFGVHPLHVESVAWASGLKDLLYVLFFLAAYICYLQYIKLGKSKFYFYCMLLFLLSLLSKAMAACFPVLLILTDYFMKRKFNAKTWLEKAPFFALSLILGVVAIYAQRSAEAIASTSSFPLSQRIVFACYGFITYLVKLVVPFNLNAFYSYPIASGQALPATYYTYVLLLLALVIYSFYSLRYSRKIAFGIGFFSITVFLVLQLLPVGGSIMADRYSYLPSIGVFFLAGEGFYRLWNKKGSVNVRTPSIVVLALFVLFYSIKTYSRCAVWKDGMTLWNDVIHENPTLSIGYYNRGVMFKNDGKMDEALADFEKTISLQPDYVSAYNNRAVILAMRKRYDDSIKDFTKALSMKPDPDSYVNRGISLQNTNRFDEAISDYNKAIEMRPNSPQAFYNRAVIEFNRGLKDIACSDFQQALNLGFPLAEQTYPKLCH